MNARFNQLEGVLLGTAVGDALGLPAEGLTPAQIERRGWRGNWQHRFIAGRGMWSDDTEHTIMLAQALAKWPQDEDRFARCFAWQLRAWLLGLPAGVGLATARAIGKLWLGFPYRKSGVFSAGNGPCMRAALLGVLHADDPGRRLRLNRIQTEITHRDPRALTASRAIVEIAALFSRDPDAGAVEVFAVLDHPDSSEEWRQIIESLQQAHAQRKSLPALLQAIGGNPAGGVSGYAFHTVPAVIHAGLLHRWDFEKTLSCILDAGGDTDTVGAIAGALCGARRGVGSIPHPWRQGVREWPTSIQDLSHLATALAEGRALRIRASWSPTLLLRNLFFLLVVLTHGFGRLLPTRSSSKSSTPLPL